MSAQRARTELLVENLANAETTHTANGGQYQRMHGRFQDVPNFGLHAAPMLRRAQLESAVGFVGQIADGLQSVRGRP